MDLLVKVVDRDYIKHEMLYNLKTLQVVECEEGKVKVFVNDNEPIEFDNIRDMGVTLWKS